MTAPRLTASVEAYLADLRSIRDSGGAAGELKDLGAGHPDLGLYAAGSRAQ